jgi:hypothetical protein
MPSKQALLSSVDTHVQHQHSDTANHNYQIARYQNSYFDLPPSKQCEIGRLIKEKSCNNHLVAKLSLFANSESHKLVELVNAI